MREYTLLEGGAGTAVLRINADDEGSLQFVIKPSDGGDERVTGLAAFNYNNTSASLEQICTECNDQLLTWIASTTSPASGADLEYWIPQHLTRAQNGTITPA